ncbi:hypothetical protein HZR84_12085 [Hyphobacterium sp. CCMP332]|nr:hypothetical protein HZR84_12085 [Hyphobacterium sp. CCMP332]
MIFIDIDKLSVEKKWLDKSKELLQDLSKAVDSEARKKIIDKVSSQKHWKQLKPALKALSYGKCWYSEAREIYSHYHVDHFRPKKQAVDDVSGKKIIRDGYWWKTFDHCNYRIAGSVGNTAKSDHFAVKRNCATCPDDDCDDEIFYLLDPTRPNDPKKLTVNENGSMSPSNPNVDHWDNLRASYTIDKLDLNYEDLMEERKVKWSIVNRLVNEVDQLDREYNENPSASREERLVAKLEEVRILLAPCEELSSTVKSCLKASRRDWALELLTENIDVDKYCKDYVIPEEKEEEDDNK